MFYFALIVSLCVLIFSADRLILVSSEIAKTFQVSPWFIGIVILGFGTSMPELVVSLSAVHNGNAESAIGNVVGSNIFNTLFILGCGALFVRNVQRATKRVPGFKVDISFLFLATVLLIVAASDSGISRLEGALFIIVMFLYCLMSLLNNRGGSDSSVGHDSSPVTQSKLNLVLLKKSAYAIAALILLIVSADYFVAGATALAKSWGVSDLVVSLTVLAAGTSLPELMVSVFACKRGEREIAFGNVIGSNIFNILVIVGVCAVQLEGGLALSSNLIYLDLPFLLLVSLLLLPLIYCCMFNYLAGLFFIGLYIFYVYFGLFMHVALFTLLLLVVAWGVLFLIIYAAKNAASLRQFFDGLEG